MHSTVDKYFLSLKAFENEGAGVDKIKLGGCGSDT